MCRSRESAEDLMQECFVRSLLSLSDGHGNVRAWLYRVARNLLFDEQRRQKPQVSLTELENIAADDGDALTPYLRNEQRRRLLMLISTLSERKREVLILQYYCNLSQKDIAALLRISHENVRVLSLRARRELKKKMEEDGYDFS